MLKAGGIWVSPAEVESRLLEHPPVREAAVVGMADADGLDKPVAVVVADGVTARMSWSPGVARAWLTSRRLGRSLFVDDLPKTGDREAAALQGASVPRRDRPAAVAETTGAPDVTSPSQ